MILIWQFDRIKKISSSHDTILKSKWWYDQGGSSTMEPGCAGRVHPLQKVILNIWYIYCWRSRTSDMISWLGQQYIYLENLENSGPIWVLRLRLVSQERPNQLHPIKFQQNYPIESKIKTCITPRTFFPHKLGKHQQACTEDRPMTNPQVLFVAGPEGGCG